MADSAEVSFSKAETTFSGFLAGFPTKAKPAATIGHAFSVSFKFNRRCVDISNIIGLAAVAIPRGVRGAVVG